MRNENGCSFSSLYRSTCWTVGAICDITKGNDTVLVKTRVIQVFVLPSVTTSLPLCFVPLPDM